MGDIQSLQVMINYSCYRTTFYQGKVSVRAERKAMGFLSCIPKGKCPQDLIRCRCSCPIYRAILKVSRVAELTII